MRNIALALDKVSLEIRHGNYSKDQLIGAQIAIMNIAKKLRLTQCTQCMRFFKSIDGHKNSHLSFFKDAKEIQI